jgi:thiosulfate dehydrogenase (quinone) large subunit
MKLLKDKRIISILWTIIRVYMGYEWITAGFEKITSSVWVGDKAGIAITGFFKGALAQATGAHPAVQGWYAFFLEHVAIPNAALFSYIVSFGEFLVGVGLILGAVTTIALIAGAFMNLNYMLAGSTSTNPILYTLAIVLLVVGANAYYWGLDRFLVIPLWQKIFKPKTAPAKES